MTPIITGAVLLLAVPITLPFLNLKLLGLIMIVAGLVNARALQRVSSWLRRNRRVRHGTALLLAGPAPSLRHGQPEPMQQARPKLTRPAGMTLIIIGTVLLTVPITLPFLNLKLLGLIMIVGGLVKARALQRASNRLWQNRRVRNGPTRPLAGPTPALGHGQLEPVRQARPKLTRPAGMTLITTGTALLLAVSIPLPFLNVMLLGLIMIVAGLVQLGWQVRRPGDLMVSYTPVTRHLVVLLPAHNEERDIGAALASGFRL